MKKKIIMGMVFFFLIICIMLVIFIFDKSNELSENPNKTCTYNPLVLSCLSITERNESKCEYFNTIENANKGALFMDSISENDCIASYYKILSILDKKTYDHPSLDDSFKEFIQDFDFVSAYQKTGKLFLKALSENNVEICDEDINKSNCIDNYYFIKAILEENGKLCKNIPEETSAIKCKAILHMDPNICFEMIEQDRCKNNLKDMINY